MQHVAEKVLPYVARLRTHPTWTVNVHNEAGVRSASIQWDGTEYVVTFEDESRYRWREPQDQPFRTTQTDTAYWKAISYAPHHVQTLKVTWGDESATNLNEYGRTVVELIPDQKYNDILLSQRALPQPSTLLDWTGTRAFQRIQTTLRESRDDELTRRFQVEFHRYARLAPDRPPGVGELQYLYRGICGPGQQAALSGCGSLESRGYMAMSTQRHVAQNFANDRFSTSLEEGGGFVARVRVASIPAGTPWLWFDRDVQTVSPVASEVLIAPGVLRLEDAATLTFSYHAR